MQDSSSAIVSADALPTVQIDNGVVWSQVMIGDIVYAGGSFTNTRPPGAAQGTNLTPRGNVLAYNIRTGQLVPGFAPQVNGQVRAITKSPDGSRIYIGGDFTSVNGVSRFKAAALNATTGALITGFSPVIGGSYVTSIAATNSVVYFGGLFTAANGNARKNLVAYSAAGALLNWTPSTDLQVDTMVIAPGGAKVIAGGRFATVNGVTQRGMVALDPSTGVIVPWNVANTIKNGASTGTYAGKAGIHSLSVDDTSVYGTGWVFANAATGNLEGAFSATAAGDLKWIEACHGDTYGVYSDGTTVYTTSHAHYCGNVGGFPQTDADWSINKRFAVAFTADVKGTLAHDAYAGSTYYDWYGTEAPSMINWFPDFYTGNYTTSKQAGWSVVGTGDYVSIGGEFPGVNMGAQYGLTRFAKRSQITPKQAPRVSGTNWPVTVNTKAPGMARISVPANWDRDNMSLTYKLIRDGNTANPVAETTVKSTFWDRPTVVLTDSNVTAGQHSYRVVATDPNGNSATSETKSGTVASGTLAAYPKRVLDEGANLYWRLGDPAGSTTASDLAGGFDGTVRSGVQLGQTGAIASDGDDAARFSGTSTGYIGANSSMSGPSTFTINAWFRTTTTRGGKIAGFGSSASGSSSSYDRHIYMDNSGRLRFGVYPGSVQVVQSPGAYNNGQWHQVTASLSSAGMALYVDGQQVAQRADVTSAQPYTGYWRVGGDSLGSWPSAPTSHYLNGTIDEFAYFDSALTAADVKALYDLGTGNVPNEAPTASFSTSVDELAVQVNAGASSDPDGTIDNYRWNWGDGSPFGSGASATHTYAASGNYLVELTVTDNDGATDSVSHTVTVAPTPPNQAPTAAFTAATDGLEASVNAGGSDDPDGTIESYAWDWGDSSADGSGQTANHTYAEDGEYTITLTVTDDDGETDTATRTVTVAAPDDQLVAADNFSRTSASGWGSADTGGSWTGAGSATLYTVDGGVGKISMIRAGQGPYATLNNVSARDVELTADVSIDKVPNGGGATAYFTVRRTAAGEERLRISWRADGSAVLSISTVNNGAETVLTSTTLSGITAADTISVRLRTVADGSTSTVSAKAWEAGTSEPSTWLRTVTDSNANAQDAGGVALRTYLSGTATNFPVTVSFDNLRVVPAS